MSVSFDYQFFGKRETPVSQEAVFQSICQYRESMLKNFPGLQDFQECGENTYRWIFKSFSHSGMELKLIFLTEIQARNRETIVISPKPEKGSGKAEGAWKVSSQGDKTELSFSITIKVELPIPFFLKAIVVPLAERELKKIFDNYLTNVIQNLET